MAPVVARLTIFPVKSLDGQTVESARLLRQGNLEHDRRFALFDKAGEIVGAKRWPALQRVRSEVDLGLGVLAIGAGGERRRFDLREERAALEQFFGAALETEVALREDSETGFPDDLDSPGPTVISTATLDAVAGWFDLSRDDARARLRTNIEIEGVPAFWEDRLFAAEGAMVPFRIGEVALVGVNPCLRCAVPTRDPRTGRADPAFAAAFADHRQRALPPWADRARFKPFYRAAVNTRRPAGAAPAIIRVGDAVALG